MEKQQGRAAVVATTEASIGLRDPLAASTVSVGAVSLGELGGLCTGGHSCASSSSESWSSAVLGGFVAEHCARPRRDRPGVIVRSRTWRCRSDFRFART